MLILGSVLVAACAGVMAIGGDNLFRVAVLEDVDWISSEACVIAQHEMVSRGLRYTCRVLCDDASSVDDMEQTALLATSKSSASGFPYVMVVENDLTHSVEALWKGYDGEEYPYGVLQEGVFKEFETYDQHAWVFRYIEDGACGAAVAVWDGSAVHRSLHHVKLSTFRQPQSPIRCRRKL
eukprot:TRINITY_DN31215_c0_g1_i1.p2 TRINITY_DN31215_c0_g1~~TRINITY_DN31215_c0_g1_i1.p2  ORF type:complete len:180 (+),score=46.37 TRINITY_DN31215_c0_g1_i1:316-855(+)